MPDDGVYRAILIVLVVSVVAGVATMLTGERLFHSPAMETAGAGLALVSGAVYFFFRWLGRREARRRGPEQSEDKIRRPD